MNDTYAFLDALGLDETADARAIRRAYARQLKQVDQALDPAGFQALREAYETALDWAAYMAQEQEQATTPPPAAPPSAQAEAAEPAEPGIPEEVKLVDIVWERFEAGMGRLAQEQRLPDPEAWHALLLARLQDDELVNIGARTQFEWRIVCMLGSGWRPGHEALFPAAVAAFGWAQDRRRLAMFAYYGNLVNAAIDERAVYDSQAIAVRSVQDRVAMLLRREKQADRRDIANSMGELRTMQQCFPTLLLVVTNPDNVAHWEAEFAEHELVPPRAPGRLEKAAPWFVKFAIVLVAFKSLQFLYEQRLPDRAGERERAAQHDSSGDSGYDPRTNPPTHAQLEQHSAPLNFQPSPDAPPGEHVVHFEVFLDAGGKVIGMNKMQDSQLPDFDAAVEAAVRASRPFPPETARIFTFGATWRIAPKTVAPAAVPAAKQI